MSQITVSNFSSGKSTKAGGVSTVTLASYTPTADAMILVTVHNGRSGTGNAQTPTVTGHGLTYSLVTNQVQNSVTSRNLSVLDTLATSPVASVLTIDFGGSGQSFIEWHIDEVIGMHPTLASIIVQSAVTDGAAGSVSSGTISFANPFANPLNATWVAFGRMNQDVQAIDTRFLVLSQQSTTNPAGTSGSMWTSVNVQSNISLANSVFGSNRQYGIGLEFAIAPASSYVPSPYYSGYYQPRVATA